MPGVPAGAATLQIVPNLAASLVYTDNVTLAPEAAATSALVVQAVPGVSLNYNGPRFKFSAGYRLEGRYDTQTGEFDYFQRWIGGTNSSMEVVPQFLYVDMTSNASQQNVSLLGPLPTDNINRTENRATVVTSVISPYIRYNFGNEAQALARLSYSVVTSDSTTGLADSTAPSLSLQLTSGPAYRLFTWYVSYYRDNISYSGGTDTVTQRFTAGASRLITSQLSLLANAGYEENGPDSQGPFWSAGLRWVPSPRTDITATLGRRTLSSDRSESNHGLLVSHRMRLLVFSASYTEAVTDSRSQLLIQSQVPTAAIIDQLLLPTIPDAVQRQQEVQNVINQNGLPSNLLSPVQTFTNQFFLSKRWSASLGLRGRRHSVIANYYQQTDETGDVSGQLAAAGIDASSTSKQTGGSLTWSWRVTQRDAPNLTIGYTQNEVPGAGRDDTLQYIRLGLNHTFNPNLSGFVSYRRLQNRSNVSAADYTENAVSAALQMRF